MLILGPPDIFLRMIAAWERIIHFLKIFLVFEESNSMFPLFGSFSGIVMVSGVHIWSFENYVYMYLPIRTLGKSTQQYHTTQKFKLPLQKFTCYSNREYLNVLSTPSRLVKIWWNSNCVSKMLCVFQYKKVILIKRNSREVFAD